LERDAFDRDKIVQRIALDGKISYLSVGWAGMTGVVTGVSEAGIYVSVNGARAGEPLQTGIPLPYVLRAILEDSRTLEDAIRIASSLPVMVSHILFIGEGSTGKMAVVERTPSRVVVRRSD